LLGFIEDTDVNKLYNISNLFIMPNLYIQEDGNVEGFGLVFLEAGATKLTSIGGNVGGSAEAIDNNKNGILVDGNNIEEIKDQIIYLMENKNIVEKLSENAFIKAQQYSWGNIIDNINDEIVESLDGENE
jgi:phosphatidylinositol alpha-1,6-mannosyltransferase